MNTSPLGKSYSEKKRTTRNQTEHVKETSGIQGRIRTVVLFRYPYVNFGINTGRRATSISGIAIPAAMAKTMKANL